MPGSFLQVSGRRSSVSEVGPRYRKEIYIQFRPPIRTACFHDLNGKLAREEIRTDCGPASQN
jgi:hypothetical protein